MQIVKGNFVEAANYANSSKEDVKEAVRRVVKTIATKVRKGELVELEIPNVGVLIVRNGIAAVEFNDYLLEET